MPVDGSSAEKSNTAITTDIRLKEKHQKGKARALARNA
jgi:hypothetical protein